VPCSENAEPPFWVLRPAPRWSWRQVRRWTALGILAGCVVLLQLGRPGGGPPPVFADVRVQVPNGADAVWITGSGMRYHREGCRSLRDSKFKTTRREAEKAGKKACSVCAP
jgi:hypothetical protein